MQNIAHTPTGSPVSSYSSYGSTQSSLSTSPTMYRLVFAAYILNNAQTRGELSTCTRSRWQTAQFADRYFISCGFLLISQSAENLSEADNSQQSMQPAAAAASSPSSPLLGTFYLIRVFTFEGNESNTSSSLSTGSLNSLKVTNVWSNQQYEYGQSCEGI